MPFGPVATEFVLFLPRPIFFFNQSRGALVLSVCLPWLGLPNSAVLIAEPFTEQETER